VSEPFKVLDLFSGIGGFSLGLERTGHFKTVAFCEIDNYCQRVLHKHWPEVYIHSDVRTLTAKHFDGWQRPDVIAGGFPCQDISLAGKGAGLAGHRSGLWSEMFRLVGELRPRYLIVENVSALLARGIDRVLGDLAGVGYDAEWGVIPACALGAPHVRERIWIVAYPMCNRHNRENATPAAAPYKKWNDSAHRQIGRAVTGSTIASREDVSNPNCSGFPVRHEVIDGGQAGRGVKSGSESFRVFTEDRQKQWEVEPNVGRVADGVPARVDRLRSLGNSIVPQIATWIGERIVEAELLSSPATGAIYEATGSDGARKD